jgi:hypothetical protein
MLLNALLQLKSAQYVSGIQLPHMMCNALFAGVRLLGVEQQAMCPG